MINPHEVKLIYDMPVSLPTFYYVEMWSALMDVAVQAYIIKDLPIQNVTMNSSAVFFILTNTLNNILLALKDSTNAILHETQNISNTVRNALKILLYVASGSLFLSICLIFPVATKVDKNKDELLRHFMLIDRDDVKKQLEKCRIFFNTMHDKDHTTQQNINDIDDDEFIDDVKDGGAGGDDADGSGPNG